MYPPRVDGEDVVLQKRFEHACDGAFLPENFQTARYRKLACYVASYKYIYHIIFLFQFAIFQFFSAAVVQVKEQRVESARGERRACSCPCYCLSWFLFFISVCPV